MLFVQRVELIASDEGNEWLARHVRRQEQSSGRQEGR
jgi:hypothetical protein